MNVLVQTTSEEEPANDKRTNNVETITNQTNYKVLENKSNSTSPKDESLNDEKTTNAETVNSKPEVSTSKKPD